MRKTVTVGATVTKTDYLVEGRNPTGYGQVIEELVSINSAPSTLSRSYVYGNDLISQKQNGGATHYYGYDGQGSVRFLINSSGQITDAYNYEAFGILLDEWHAGTATPNDYLYTGERYDADLGLYYGERVLGSQRQLSALKHTKFHDLQKRILGAKGMYPKKGNSAAKILKEHGFDNVVEEFRAFYKHPDVVEQFPNGGALFEQELEAIIDGATSVANKIP